MAEATKGLISQTVLFCRVLGLPELDTVQAVLEDEGIAWDESTEEIARQIQFELDCAGVTGDKDGSPTL